MDPGPRAYIRAQLAFVDRLVGKYYEPVMELDVPVRRRARGSSECPDYALSSSTCHWSRRFHAWAEEFSEFCLGMWSWCSGFGNGARVLVMVASIQPVVLPGEPFMPMQRWANRGRIPALSPYERSDALL